MSKCSLFTKFSKHWISTPRKIGIHSNRLNNFDTTCGSKTLHMHAHRTLITSMHHLRSKQGTTLEKSSFQISSHCIKTRDKSWFWYNITNHHKSYYFPYQKDLTYQKFSNTDIPCIFSFGERNKEVRRGWMWGPQILSDCGC